MNAKPTTPIFDTCSTGSPLSGSSTSASATYISPTIARRDAACQTSPRIGTVPSPNQKPYTYFGTREDTKSDGTTFELHQDVSQSSPSPTIASTGPQSNGGGESTERHSTRYDETKQETDVKVLCEQKQGLAYRISPSHPDIRDGCNSCLPGRRRTGHDCRGIAGTEFKSPTDIYKLAFCVDCKCYVQLKKE